MYSFPGTGTIRNHYKRKWNFCTTKFYLKKQEVEFRITLKNYDQIMGALLQSKAKGTKISALVIWSLYDGVSWRASSAPCLFNGLYSPKSAFFAVANAKDAYK